MSDQDAQSARRRWRAPLAAGAVAAAALSLSACGSSSHPTTIKTADVGHLAAGVKGTLTQWNWETEADDPGEHALLPGIISSFEKKYPGLKVTNVEMTLDEQNDKLPLALSSASSTPDLTETNEGYQSMGRLVTDGELLPLTKYVSLYHWDSKVGKLPLQYNSFSTDGKYLGQGDVYGVPWSAAPLGVFYNKALIKQAGGKVPTNWSTLFADLPLLKKAGITPLAYASGNPTVDQPVHDFYMLADAFTSPSTTIDFVFHKGAKPTIDVPGYVKAAQTMQAWGKAGYFPSGYSGMSGSQALTQFTSGKAAFFIEGEWYIGPIQQALHANAGFWVPQSTTGGPGEGYSIPSQSSQPKAAAAFIDETLSPTVQAEQLKEGEVPVVAPSASVLAHSPTMIRAATLGWQRTVKANTLVPYLDYATPNYLNQLLASVQELQAGRLTPTSMISQLQSDYTTYWSSK